MVFTTGIHYVCWRCSAGGVSAETWSKVNAIWIHCFRAKENWDDNFEIDKRAHCNMYDQTYIHLRCLLRGQKPNYYSQFIDSESASMAFQYILLM